MQFAAPIPLWLAAILAAAIGGMSFVSYRRPLVPLSIARRGSLMALRAASLAALLILLCRPIVLVPARPNDFVLPVLVDVSRSMRVTDAGGAARLSSLSKISRLSRATQVLRDELLPALSQRFVPEIYAIGDDLTPITLAALTERAPAARHSNLDAALAAIRDRYRGRTISGIILISDGADTTQQAHAGHGDERAAAGPPVFAVGVGQATGLRDREVLGVTVGDPRLDQASVDLHVSAVSHGYGRQPFDLQVRANGQLIDSRRVTPAADGSPVEETFTIVPDAVTATVLTVDIAAGEDEPIAENNTRGIIINPPGRQRRILAIEGAPGFEHSFIMRALSQDPGLDIDSVVRKGKNEAGHDTFFVQAAGGRAASLAQGFPESREALFAYDAIIIANVEGDVFTSAQLAMTADFVSVRGGGLLVLGGRSFAQRGLIGTPLEEVLPVELNDRRGGLLRTSIGADVSAPHNKVVVTREGEGHPVMRIGPSSTSGDTRRQWAALPALAATAPLGGPRPGASILAVATAPGGIYPVVAVQQYGRGRSMVFAGEASWRWRMMLPATDRSFEFFWRQSARWLAGPAPDAITLTVPGSAEPGDSVAIEIDARDAAYAPLADAAVDVTLTAPGGASQPLAVRRNPGAIGRFTAAVALEQPGLYRVHAQARRAGAAASGAAAAGAAGAATAGTADRWFYVGGGDREFADPRLNEGVLRRIARSSGGRYLPIDDARRLPEWLAAAVPQRGEPERRDLWHQPWAYAIVVALLASEWMLRRFWGLR